MTEKILTELRAVSVNLKNCIISGIILYGERKCVIVNITSDCAFTEGDKAMAEAVLRKYVPQYFECTAKISKLAPDCEMVKRKIKEFISSSSKAIAVTLDEDDVKVIKTEEGFEYTVEVTPSLCRSDLCDKLNKNLKNVFCGEFSGKMVSSGKNLENLQVEEKPDEIEFEVPIRTFEIEDFEIIEGDKIQKTAVYLADLNFSAEEVVICGTIENLRERTYTNKNGTEKSYLSIALNDSTATAYITYFIRQKTSEKIKALKVGDSIVCTGTNEEFKGELRYTAKVIDYGKIPNGFVPEKRMSKSVPNVYKFVSPQKYSAAEQSDIFTENYVPECLKGKTFVVFDLETTGLNSSPVSGNMDKIIEIGAYKITDGEICESFSTFVNPARRLSEEIINITGITEEMVAPAPKYEDVMPDFYKFCYGSILVGHNLVGFDYKFVDYYWSRLGYIFDRKLIDTIPLSQELLYLSNYKLNTVADRFKITFNHHRAVDDALATAKIFIELIKIKKSLPKLQ